MGDAPQPTERTGQTGLPAEIRASPDTYALYVHIPFCRTRCHYCDFNTYAGMDDWMDAYVDGLAREARLLAGSAPGLSLLSSIYLGGGTPSRLRPAHLERLLETIRARFLVGAQAEISLEANPGEVSGEFLRAAQALGLNRISLGMQSADDRILRWLGRGHTHAQTRQAVGRVRRAGFTNLSLDLIAGVPDQDLTSWRATVDSALALQPEHLSVYALSIEPGTPLEAQIARRRVAAPDDDRTADLLDWLDERLPAAGFQQYEISNWARAAAATGSGQPEFACRHNLSYWTNRPYLGLGAGAHGYAGGLRTANVRPIVEYVRRLTGRAGAQRFPITPAAEAWRKVEPDEAALDSMLLGLRLTHTGVGRGDYVARHGRAAWEAMLSRSSQLVEAGLLEAPDNGSSLRLTWRGRRLGNRVFREFV